MEFHVNTNLLAGYFLRYSWRRHQFYGRFMDVNFDLDYLKYENGTDLSDLKGYQIDFKKSDIETFLKDRGINSHLNNFIFIAVFCCDVFEHTDYVNQVQKSDRKRGLREKKLLEAFNRPWPGNKLKSVIFRFTRGKPVEIDDIGWVVEIIELAKKRLDERQEEIEYYQPGRKKRKASQWRLRYLLSGLQEFLLEEKILSIKKTKKPVHLFIYDFLAFIGHPLTYTEVRKPTPSHEAGEEVPRVEASEYIKKLLK